MGEWGGIYQVCREAPFLSVFATAQTRHLSPRGGQEIRGWSMPGIIIAE